jgi:hypothetical protein
MLEREFWGPIPHWNNFTIQELKEILEHCAALDRLGIAQDEKMIASIERDIALREKETIKYQVGYKPKPTKTKRQVSSQNLLVANI